MDKGTKRDEIWRVRAHANANERHILSADRNFSARAEKMEAALAAWLQLAKNKL